MVKMGALMLHRQHCLKEREREKKKRRTSPIKTIIPYELSNGIKTQEKEIECL